MMRILWNERDLQKLCQLQTHIQRPDLRAHRQKSEAGGYMRGMDGEEMSDRLISLKAAIDKFEPWLKVEGYSEGELNMLKAVLYELRAMPPAQPELIEKVAYIRGFEQGRTQGRIDAQDGRNE